MASDLFGAKPLSEPMLIFISNGPWASYQIRKIAGCACTGNAGNIFPRRRFERTLLVSDPVMHHGMCATHVPWCMSGSLTRGGGENVPGIPSACAFAILWSGKRPIVNKLQWNYNEDRTVCIQENEFENVVCQKLSPFLSFHVLFCHIRQQ